jgi:pectate lyase
MKSRMFQGRRLIVCSALAMAGAFLALNYVLSTSAQTTLFSDNFQDGNATGWSKSGGTWAVVTDGGSLVYRQSGTSADSRARSGSLSWTDYSVQARVKPIAFNGAGRYVGLLARAINVNHFYYLALQNGNQLVLAKRDGDSSTTLASRSFTVTTGTFYTLRLDVRGSSLTGFVNGVSQLSATDSQFTAGNIGGATFFSSGAFDDFVVTSLSGGGSVPATPTGLAATAGNGQVSLTWNASSGATSYNVKRSTVSGGPYTTIASVTSTSFNNTGLTNGTTYFFVVSAVNSAGQSANSSQVTATPTNTVTIPAPPTGLNATPGDGSVSLAWNASAGATSYNVKRATVSGGPYAVIASVSGTSFNNTGLVNGTTFFYVVSAQNSAGQSANSAQVSATPTSQGAPNFGLFGFAAGNTTGGRGGSTVTVTSLSALQTAAASSSPMIIQISGRITGSDIVRVESNKTIVGLGSTGELVGIELGLADSSNIIIRNLKISGVLASNHDGDAIHLQNTHNVWIDHCELFAEPPQTQPDVDLYDGLVDITRDCSFITISWCYFHDSWKTSLIGSSDDDNFDRRTTFHHNFYQNVNSRVPSYRFGVGHVFNNYYLDVLTSGVNTRMGAVLRIEGNVFERVDDPITSIDSDNDGFWDVRDNQFINCTGSQPTSSNGSFNPPYNYPLDSSANVRAIVRQWAGVGKINPLQGLP